MLTQCTRVRWFLFALVATPLDAIAASVERLAASLIHVEPVRNRNFDALPDAENRRALGGEKSSWHTLYVLSPSEGIQGPVRNRFTTIASMFFAMFVQW